MNDLGEAAEGAVALAEGGSRGEMEVEAEAEAEAVI
jgi:hypothetical protein